MNGENEQRDPKEAVRAKKVRGHTLWLSKQTRLLIFSSVNAPCTLLVQPLVYPLTASLHIVLLDVVLIDSSHHSWTPPILLLSPYVSLCSPLSSTLLILAHSNPTQ